MQPGFFPAAETMVINFAAEVNPTTAESLLSAMANCANSGAKNVHLLLSTPGGNVMQGMTIYNVLRGMPFTLTTHNVGNVDSIGNMIFLAGDRRYSAPGATFMFHGVAFNAPAGAQFSVGGLRELLDSMTSDEKRIGAVIADRSKLTPPEVGALFLEAQTRDAMWAVEKGIVHEVREVELPTGAPVLSLVFQR